MNGRENRRQQRAVCAAALICASLLAGGVAKASYTVSAEPLEKRVKEAELVVTARVRSIEHATYSEHRERVRCGMTYVVDVLHTYKGRRLQQLKFSVYALPVHVAFHTVNVGDDLLLLLHTEHGRSDPAPAELPDVILAEPSIAKALCLDRLAALRPDWTDGGFPLIHESDQPDPRTTWLAYTRSRTTMPDIAGQRPYAKDCRGEMCDMDGRRMVPWDALEPKIKEWSR